MAIAVAEWVVVAALGFVHIFVHRLRQLSHVPRSRWLSVAGGASVAYVFLHILPELAAQQDALGTALGLSPLRAEEVVYAVAMAGLVAFYGLERYMRTRPDPRSDGNRIHLGSFALYNVLVGYLIFHREDAGALSLALFAVAIGFHFLTVDHGLRVDHHTTYDRLGRWLLTAALVVGALLGQAIEVPEVAVALPFALLAGSILLNVLKDELPAERESKFIPFVLGAAVYAGLLFVV